ncbi:histone deacetylase family protein [Taibaiella soli]|uniref:Histone deacetylase n=1 Tax=Taibaiella soli TaxID=1649169 RepID=A0A2W2B238_9BACT|nr:histone deacetylase [Taibaiella soli]PZF74088.1 histone deacetylase [Taibaiella soli]
MKYIAYDPIFAHPLPDGHRFPMAKYELIPGQLIYEGVITEANLFAPQPAAEEDILRAHDADYWRRMKNQQLTEREMRAIGFPLSAQLVEREIRIAQGSIDCALIALQNGVALNVAGGTHHAFPDKGEGFCLLNDFAIAAHYLLHHQLAKKILIIDLDVHQGNGTAAIFKDDPRVFTFSVHGQHNYPFRKETSSLDIGLPDGTSGIDYLNMLERELPALFASVQPDFVFYLSGVDVLATDKLGKLKLSLTDCKHRDEIVFSLCRRQKLSVAVAMGGGYSADVRQIVTAHCNTFKMAKEIFDLH